MFCLLLSLSNTQVIIHLSLFNLLGYVLRVFKLFPLLFFIYFYLFLSIFFSFSSSSFPARERSCDYYIPRPQGQISFWTENLHLRSNFNNDILITSFEHLLFNVVSSFSKWNDGDDDDDIFVFFNNDQEYPEFETINDGIMI